VLIVAVDFLCMQNQCFVNSCDCWLIKDGYDPLNQIKRGGNYMYHLCNIKKFTFFKNFV
jgi:hypothetical protein